MNREALDGADPRARRRRSARAAAVFAAGSVAVHAAMLFVLPGSQPEFAPERPVELEVRILPPTPLPPLAAPRLPQAVPPPRAQRAPAPLRARAPLTVERPAAPPVQAARVVPAAAPPPAPTEVPVQEARPAMAAVRVTLPRFDAAYLSNPPPRYPHAARRAGEQGTVLLRVQVGRDGLPARVDVEQSSGSAYLDAAAQAAVRGWRFEPARRGTEPVESQMMVPVVFRLEGASPMRDK